MDKTREQHRAYVTLLIELGVDIIRLEQLPNYPDCCFVEDTAVIHGSRALISRMGASSREGEQTQITQVLSEYLKITHAENPATIEGGDVIHTPQGLIAGLTQRTNQAGIDQASTWLDVTVSTVKDPTIVHLKSFTTYLGDNQMLVTEKFAHHPAFSGFDHVLVPQGEQYAANSLTIDEVTIIPRGYPRTETLLRELDREVITLDMSEFEKCEGALTCLSLLF